MTKIVRREKINRELDSRKQKDEENRIVHKGGQAQPALMETSCVFSQDLGALYLEKLKFRNKVLPQEKMVEYLESMNEAISAGFDSLAQNISNFEMMDSNKAFSQQREDSADSLRAD